MESQYSAVTLLVGRRIYTGFRPVRYVEALVSINGRIVFAGSYERAKRVAENYSSKLGEQVAELDYREYTGVPGFVDCHAHIGGLGFASTGVDLRGMKSIEEFKDRISRESRRFKDWVYGRGWNQEEMGAWPTRWDLDEVLGDKPGIFLRVCGHVAVLNTVALKRLGLYESRSKLVDRGCSGEPTGIIYEGLVSRVLEEVKKHLNSVEIVKVGVMEALRNGVTMIGDMDVGWKWLKGLWSLYSASSLVLPRIRIYLRLKVFEEFASIGIRAPIGSSFIRIVGVKGFADGSLGARTAFLSEPYSDEPGKRGFLLMDSRDIARLASRASSLGYDVAIHAIGDAALDEVIEGFSLAGFSGRVEHASITRPEQIARMAVEGLRVSLQPRFISSDSSWIKSRLGDRIRLAYLFKSIIEGGVKAGFSSDAPVEPINPLEGIYSATIRPGVLGQLGSEKLSVEDAFYLYTKGSAMVLREPAAGCLEPGCYSDVVFLPQDPLGVSLEELLDLEILATIVGGNVAWEK